MAHYEPSHLDLQCLQIQPLLCLALKVVKRRRVASSEPGLPVIGFCICTVYIGFQIWSDGVLLDLIAI